MIHQSVIDKFIEFSTPLEGNEHAPYLDSIGLPSYGIGFLAWDSHAPQPAHLALGVKWTLPDGSTASDAEVIRQITALHAQPALAHYKATSQVVLNATTVRVNDEEIKAELMRRLTVDYRWLEAHHFPQIGAWPADAQLAALSVAWAVGPDWPSIFGNAKRSLAASPARFLEAIIHMPDAAHPGHFLPAEIDIKEQGNPGIVPRNVANELALSNAEIVQQRGSDVSVLYWPSSPLMGSGVA